MEKKLSLLVDGRIPKHTECPFAKECIIKQAGTCHHTGKDHPNPFSCASARAFDLLQANERLEYEVVGVTLHPVIKKN